MGTILIAGAAGNDDGNDPGHCNDPGNAGNQDPGFSAYCYAGNRLMFFILMIPLESVRLTAPFHLRKGETS